MLITLFPPLLGTIVLVSITVTVKIEDIAPIKNESSMRLESNHTMAKALARFDLAQQSPKLQKSDK